MNLPDLYLLHPTPLDKHWLDGPGLALWIRERHGNLSAQLGADLRRVQTWEQGTPAELGAADKILTRLGNHIHELPPGLWIKEPYRARNGLFAPRQKVAV